MLQREVAMKDEYESEVKYKKPKLKTFKSICQQLNHGST